MLTINMHTVAATILVIYTTGKMPKNMQCFTRLGILPGQIRIVPQVKQEQFIENAWGKVNSGETCVRPFDLSH